MMTTATLPPVPIPIVTDHAERVARSSGGPQPDHVLGPGDARITLVEFGSYACPYCRAADESIAAVRDRFGERMRYVFRQRPLANNDLARRAAELAERADDGHFWNAHIALMTRSQTLTEEDLVTVAADLRLDHDAEQARRAKQRVDADEASARASGAMVTPSFFINNRRYDGPWDESSLSDAMLGTLGHRVRSAALDFVSWGPSAGVLLLVATLLALALTNSPLGPAFRPSGSKTSASRWVAPDFICRCGLGSMTGC